LETEASLAGAANGSSESKFSLMLLELQACNKVSACVVQGQQGKDVFLCDIDCEQMAFDLAGDE